MPYRPNKKIIEFGWDMPSAAFVRDNIREMEKRPFNGLIFAPGPRIPITWDPKPWDGSVIQLETLKAIRFEKFTDNFLVL